MLLHGSPRKPAMRSAAAARASQHTLTAADGRCRVQVQGNQLTALPTTLTACRLLRRLDASRNGLLAFQGRLYLWDKLRHLDLASNCLRTLPSALGWLCLESLDVASNRDLRVPRIVLEQPDAPVAALLTFLQIICEQHRLIERHMDKFACLPGRDLPADFLTAGALAARSTNGFRAGFSGADAAQFAR